MILCAIYMCVAYLVDILTSHARTVASNDCCRFYR